MLRRIAFMAAGAFMALVQAKETLQGDEKFYVCDALNVSELNGRGELSQTNFAKAVAMYESRFAVDRETGQASGGPFDTWDAKNTQVLSPCTDEEAFKVLWLAHAPYPHLKYLLVKS